MYAWLTHSEPVPCTQLCFFYFFFCFFSVDPTAPDYTYNQPKFIVYYEMLLNLFLLFCFNCKAENPQVTMRQNGTMVTVMQQCRKCKGFFWNSQSYMPHGKYPAGNILLSLAVLMAGASVSKVLLLFRHLGLCCYSSRTFFSHQRSFIFPTVIRHWELYRAGLVSKLKDMKDVVWSGDGRFDSMGHSAKYGAYTMFSTSIMKVVHFELVQVWKALTSCHSLSTKIFQQLLCSYCNN